MKDIRQRLLDTFQIEHGDHIEQIRSFLATIDSEPVPPASTELEEAFRRAHSLKGAARAVDLNAVEGLAHRLETLFSRVRQGVLLLDRNVASVAQQVLDASEDCVAGLADNRFVPGFESSLRAIEQVLGMKSEPSAAPVISRPERRPPRPLRRSKPCALRRGISTDFFAPQEDYSPRACARTWLRST